MRAVILVGALLLAAAVGALGIVGGRSDSAVVLNETAEATTNMTLDLTGLEGNGVVTTPLIESSAHTPAVKRASSMEMWAILPITSNTADGEYPLEQFVALASDLLVAELTGAGAEAYPWLEMVESPCCKRVEFLSATVLFGRNVSEPTSILIEWEGYSTEGAYSDGATETIWYYEDGTWRNEFAR